MATPSKTPARNKRIIRLYREKHLSISEIAPLVGLSQTRIQQILSDSGVRRRSNGWSGRELPRNRTRNDRIVRMYAKDLPTSQIAQRLNMSQSGVVSVLRARGVPRKPNGYFPKPTPELSLRLRAYAQSIADIVGTGPGCSAAELARKGGFNPETLRGHLRDLGVYMRTGVSRAAGGRLNVQQVADIKAALRDGKATATQLATRYRVAHGTIWAISARESWADIPAAPRRSKRH